MYEEIINKKEKGLSLSYEELNLIFNDYLNSKVSDELMTKLLKAICKNNLNMQEIYDLTDIFIKSGDTLDLSFFTNVVDKHSTGGVGDKTTLIIAPIVASLGIKMPKMSGRGLGFTGGTIDKLESIGVNTNLTDKEFIKEVNDIGFAITGQTKNLCPMDKKIYALRDVTGTTENIGLIATSIMSKKIASGALIIVIDLKVGNAALIKNIKDARKLAKVMINIGKKYKRKVVCVLTNMNNPLGNNIGNAIEVMEVIDILQNKIHSNLYELCVSLSTIIVSLGLKISEIKAKQMVLKVIKEKTAYNKFLEFVNYQGGNIDNLKLEKGYKIYSDNEGYITHIDVYSLGKLSMELGAGRKKKDDLIDYKAGIILNKNVSDYVKKGELLCTLYGKKLNFSDVNKNFFYQSEKGKVSNIVIDIIK